MSHLINGLIVKTAKAINDSETFSIFDINSKLEKAFEAFPYDTTIITMKNVLDKRASNNSFITRKELRSLYDRFYSSNNKFAGLFKDELGLEDRPTTKVSQPKEQPDLYKEAVEKVVDKNLVHVLEGMFDKQKEKTLPPNILAQAEKNTDVELKSLGVKPNKIKAAAGNNEIIICQASFDTPKGQVHAYLPVEIKVNKVLFPGSFLKGNSFVVLNADSIKDFIVKNAGCNTWVDSRKLLTKLEAALHPVVADETDDILLDFVTSKGTKTLGPNQILGQKVEAEVKPIEEPKVEIPEEIKLASSLWGNITAEAEFVHGKNAVNIGRNYIKNAFTNFGYKNVQVGVSNFDKSEISFAASIDGDKSIIIPVKVRNKNIESPSVILASNDIFDFTAEGVSEALQTASFDSKAAAKISPMYGLKASELIDIIKQSMQEKHFKKAEDALNVLRAEHSSDIFNVAFEVYKAGLRGDLEKKAEVKRCCSFTVKNANSQHILCGHTMLPLHKVYQDEFGDCHPLYRKAMKDNNDGANFMASKIILT